MVENSEWDIINVLLASSHAFPYMRSTRGRRRRLLRASSSLQLVRPDFTRLCDHFCAPFVSLAHTRTQPQQSSMVPFYRSCPIQPTKRTNERPTNFKSSERTKGKGLKPESQHHGEVIQIANISDFRRCCQTTTTAEAKKFNLKLYS